MLRSTINTTPLLSTPSVRSFVSLGLRRRLYSTTPPFPEATPKHGPEQAKERTTRLPKWASKYADRFKNHPTSHITSFLILHELTALLPLPILWWFFHSFDWTPEKYIEKGAKAAGKQLQKWGLNYTGDDGSRYVFEGAAAYAVVKLLLPLRVGLSLSLTPWFARRIVVPFTGLFKRRANMTPKV